jgi:hypothetical protein
MINALPQRLAQRVLARKPVQEATDLVCRARETVADCRNTCHTVGLQRELARMLASRRQP